MEGKILRRILMVSLEDSSVLYLKKTADEIRAEGNVPLLTREIMERVLLDRLSGTFVNVEPPFDYLVNCHRRAGCVLNEMVAAGELKHKKMKSDMEKIVKKMKTLLVSYCWINLCNPNLFPNYGENNSGASPLLQLALEGSDFLSDLLKVDYIFPNEPVLRQLYEDLRLMVLKISICGEFLPPLRALSLLVDSPLGARALVDHPSWFPQLSVLNGRRIEMSSILGAYFHVSALRDHVRFKSEPDVWQKFFSMTPPKSEDSFLKQINEDVKTYYIGLAHVLECLVKLPDTRENILHFLGQVVNRNSSRAGLVVDLLSCASSGMFFNLSLIMLRLSSRFIPQKKLEEIDAQYGYVFKNQHLEFRGLTRLNAEETSEYEEISEDDEVKSYPFESECFFMTARVLHLGLIKAVSDYHLLTKNYNERKAELSSLKDMHGESPSDELEGNILSCETEIQSLEQGLFCYKAQMGGFILMPALTYYKHMMLWLAGLLGPLERPLPSPPGGPELKIMELPSPSACPKGFAYIPEHFVEDILNLLELSPKINHALVWSKLGDFVNCMVMFTVCPEYIHNPYLRAEMVAILHLWITKELYSKEDGFLFTNHAFQEHLVESFLKVYDNNGFNSHDVTHEEAQRNMWHELLELILYLWRNQSLLTVWKHRAEEEKEEVGLYARFLSILIGDTNNLSCTCLDKIMKLNSLEAEMGNEEEWGTRSAEEREEKERFFVQEEMVVALNMGNVKLNMRFLKFISEQIAVPFLRENTVEKIVALLNYLLTQLAGDKREKFSLRDPNGCGFEQTLLVKQAINMYLALSRADKDDIFPEVIAKHGCSKKHFDSALEVVMECDNIIIKELEELGRRASASDIQNIPAEFLDGITCTVMKDPVLMRGVNMIVDRSTVHNVNMKNPFDRTMWTENDVIPQVELKAKIEQFMETARKGKRKRED